MKLLFYFRVTRIYTSTYQHIKWDYDKLSMNTSISPSDVRNNPDIKWNYHILSSNPMNSF